MLLIKEPQRIELSRKVFLPVYLPLLDSKCDIDFLYGGRDSGKSRFIAMMLVYLCLKLPYFRCVLVRKVFNTVKESQWQTIKDVCEDWGVSHLFSFNISPLEIKCVNGNRFICRGMDEPGNLKSISNPNYAWVEEGNQLESNDFILLMTSLRYNKGRTKTFFSFNPEAPGDYEDFWLYKMFYKPNEHQLYDDFVSTWTIPVGDTEVNYSFSSTHTTYSDNRYCSPERAAFLENLEKLDPYYYKVFTKGIWGNRNISDPFCFAFDKAKHVGPTVLNRSFTTFLSFDFNVNPITCGVFQEQGPGKIRGIESIKLDKSDIHKLCKHITDHYAGCLFTVTGDATGKNTSALVQDGINYYTVIKNKLKLADPQIKVPSVNPRVSENRVLVNYAFQTLDIKLDPVKCKGLIFDCQNVAVNDVGEIDKGNRANPKKRSDHLDGWRYYLNAFHRHILKS